MNGFGINVMEDEDFGKSIQIGLTPKQMLELLMIGVKNCLSILIKGAPGIGKTELVYEAARRNNTQVILSHPVVDDPVDYKGMPYVLEDINGNKYATFLPFGNLKAAIDAKEPTIYFLDDLGQATPAVQAAAMQLLLARKINDHDVSEHITFMAATNRKKDKAGVSGILEPVKSRFATIVELIVHAPDWIEWALKAGVPTELIHFIRWKNEMLFQFEPTSDLTNSPCPRTVENVGRLFMAGIPKEIEYSTYAGTAGEGFATEFIAFLDVFRDLPDPDWCLMNPTMVDIPSFDDKPAVLYAIAANVAKKASHQNMERFVTLANRFPDDFSVMMMRDALINDETLKESRAYIEWVVNHEEVLT